MKNPYIIPALIVAAAILAGFWILKSPIVVKPPDISIHLAAIDGNIEAVKQHIAAGTDVNTKDEDGLTPLHDAAARDHKGVAELLIAKGADVNAKGERHGWTPLHFASTRWRTRKDHKETVELLIAKGADVNARTNNGTTPLDTAIEELMKNLTADQRAAAQVLKFDSEYFDLTGTAAILRKHGGKTGEELKAEGK